MSDSSAAHPRPVAPAVLRDGWLGADRERFLADCEFSAHRGPGPGGQKRNKTSSSVRLLHKPTGLFVVAGEKRSQADNLELARRRLRLKIATDVRSPGSDSVESLKSMQNWPLTRARSDEFALIVARLFDVLDANAWTIFQAAEQLETTTAAISKLILRDDAVQSAVNRHRRRLGMRPLS